MSVSAIAEFRHEPGREALPEPWQASIELVVRMSFSQLVQFLVDRRDLAVQEFDLRGKAYFGQGSRSSLRGEEGPPLLMKESATG